MESVRSSRRHVRRGGKFVFEIWERFSGLCLIGKIIPLHHYTLSCVTVNQSMALEVLDQFRYKFRYKFVIYASIIEFYKGVAQLEADRSLRVLYLRVAFVWKRLVNFKDFPFQVIHHICRPNIIWRACNNPSHSVLNFCNLSFSCLPHVSHRGEQ